jgi:hypothetical protein
MTQLPVSILHVRNSNGSRFETQGCRPTPQVDAALGR